MRYTRNSAWGAVTIFAVIVVSVICSAQANVTTWHNDNFRTGQQLAETMLSPSNVSSSTFGLLFQYPVDGQVYAQPLAMAGLSGVAGCASQTSCDVVFVATQNDNLYAFDADNNANSSVPLWHTNVADFPVVGGYAVPCTWYLPSCNSGSAIYPNVGVTSTPVIDSSTSTLYVVSALLPDAISSTTFFFLHAIDIFTGNEKPNSPISITASVPGKAVTTDCTSSTGGSTVTLDPNKQLQRPGLLLLPVTGGNAVYVGFSLYDGARINGVRPNGWILGYTYNTIAGFTQVAAFNTSPNGSGGGVWQSAAGLAAETDISGHSSIYVSTADGTFDASTGGPDYGDSLLKLTVSATGSLSVVNNPPTYAYFTPSDQATRCANDTDFGSGGVMLFRDSFYQGYNHLLVHIDKESKLFTINRDNLAGYNPTDNTVQEIILPINPPQQGQGYWSALAYWKWVSGATTNYAVYGSAQVGSGLAPLPLNMYQLSTAPPGPFPSSPTASSTATFCQHGTTASISANGSTTGTGIVWAIENRFTTSPLNCNGTPTKAVLHAFNAQNIGGASGELYNSGSVTTTIGAATKFSTPTPFNHRVYMGTQTEVDVFGLCNSQAGGCLH